MANPVAAGFVPQTLRRIEAVFGLLTAGLIEMILLSVGISISAEGSAIGGAAKADMHTQSVIVLALLPMTFEAVCICLVWNALVRDRLDPFAPQLALRWRHLPSALRPIAAAWWLAHFGLGVSLAFMIELNLARVNTAGNGLGPYGVAVQFAAFVAIGFTLSFAFNLYALLAMTAAGCGERAVAAVWRGRFQLDLAIAIAAAVVAGWMPSDGVPRVPPRHHRPAAVSGQAGSVEAAPPGRTI